MTITTKYSPGDTVWGVVKDSRPKTVPCPNCQGARLDGYTCNSCHGTGKRSYPDISDTTFSVRGPMIVGQVRVQITDSPGIEGELIFDNYKSSKGREEEYMCVQTGIGCGQLWDVEKLFSTESLCQTECDRLLEEFRLSGAAYVCTACSTPPPRGGA